MCSLLVFGGPGGKHVHIWNSAGRPFLHADAGGPKEAHSEFLESFPLHAPDHLEMKEFKNRLSNSLNPCSMLLFSCKVALDRRKSLGRVHLNRTIS
jgi:hypothetical protein